MEENINDKKKVLLNFNQNDSCKANAIKNIFKSKIVLVFLAMFILYNLFNLLSIIFYNLSLIESFDFKNIGSLLFDILLELLLPIIFGRYIYILYMVSNDKKVKKYHTSTLDQIFLIRRFLKVFLIFFGIMYLILGLSYINTPSLVNELPEILEQLEITIEEIDYIVRLGYYNILLGTSYLLIAYAILKASKVMFKAIIMDEKDNKYIELIIASIVLLIFSLLLSFNVILSSVNVITFISPSAYSFNNISDIFSFIGDIIFISNIFVVILIILKVRKALINNSGSLNILDSDEVYTIDIDE